MTIVLFFIPAGRVTAIEALEESEFVEAIDYRIFYEMNKVCVE